LTSQQQQQQQQQHRVRQMQSGFVGVLLRGKKHISAQQQEE
jgi:hypothetical protein